MKKNHYFCISTVFVIFFFSCSVKKDKAVNRFYHNTTAWFNTLFNANEALKKEMQTATQDIEDDYGELLKVNPGQIIESKVNDADYEYEAQDFKGKKPKTNLKNIGQKLNKIVSFGGQVDQMIQGNSTTQNLLQAGSSEKNNKALSQEKAIKAIENHSMYIKNKERNPIMAEAFLILGKSNYIQGRSYEALDALNYLRQNVQLKNKKKDAHYKQEASFWIAKANLQAGNNFYAKDALKRLYAEPNINRNTKKDIALLHAQILIDEKKYTEAIEGLETAYRNTKNKKEKARNLFIQAQLQNHLGHYIESSRLYAKVEKMHPGFEMEFQSKIGIAANFDPQKNDYNRFQSALDKLLDNNNYEENLAEIYQVKALIAHKAQKEEEAVAFFKKSLQKAINPTIKTNVYKEMATVYYQKGDYIKSSLYYDSAIAVAQKPTVIAQLEKKSKPLQTLRTAYELVQKSDSILSLSNLSPEAQTAQIQKQIEDKVRALQQKQTAAHHNKTAVTENNQSRNQNNLSYQTQNIDAGGKFYFYNSSLKEKGIKEFKLIWGTRALGDNWRINNIIKDIEVVENQITTTTENIPNSVEFYLKQLPQTAIEKAQIKNQRDSAQYIVGTAYKSLENYDASTKNFEKLLKFNPKDELKAQTYYQLFLLARLQKLPYENYQNSLLTDFPNTPYASLVKNPDAENFVIKNTDKAVKMYEDAFAAYEKQDWATYEKIRDEAIMQYGKEEIIAKFALLNAYYFAKTKSKEDFLSTLENVVLVYPNFPEGKKAEELIMRYYEMYPETVKNKTNLNESNNPAKSTIIETNTEKTTTKIIEDKTTKTIEELDAELLKEIELPDNQDATEEIDEEMIKKTFGH